MTNLNMKTIEERAREYVQNANNIIELPARRYGCFVRQVSRAYIAGATEQKVIDDAEYVNKVLMGKGSSINYYKQGYHDAIDKVCEWLRARNVITKDTLIGFRKAMEEQL